MDPPWSVRVEDEAPLSPLAMVRGDACVTPPQLVIHPGERCTTPDGQDLAQAMDLGVRTWGNSQHGSTVMLAAPPGAAGARAARRWKRQERETRRVESAPISAGS
jgi:hypothetical protein